MSSFAEDLEFQPWPKTFRVNRVMIVTEKIHGSNAAVRILLANGPSHLKAGDIYEKHLVVEAANGLLLFVGAQSRKKLITPGKQTDNFGFAQFVFDNAQAFVDTLGEGIHFGEWYGPGINYSYGLEEKRFMLFNTTHWGAIGMPELLSDRFGGRVEVATVLYEGPFDTGVANAQITKLKHYGSQHVPGCDWAEGVIVHHTQANLNLKITCEKDSQPKGISHA